PAGNPMARMAEPNADPRDGIVLRIHESTGRPAPANVSTLWPITGAIGTNATEETSRTVPTSDDGVALPVEPFEIATLRVMPRAATESSADPESSAAPEAERGPRAEPAQPVYSQYWMHNTGAAPLGYQPVTVQVRPRFVRGGGPYRVEAIVASGRPDAATPGTVTVVAPPGWAASPPSRLFTLAPGAHLVLESTLTPANDARPGRYFAAARIEDQSGQVHEDVLTIDHDPVLAGRDGTGRGEIIAERPLLGQAMARAMRRAEP